MSNTRRFSNLFTRLAVLTALVALLAGLSFQWVRPALASAAYYIDCSAPTNGNGTQASPWNNLASVNAPTFVAGDSLLFKRGATCSGMLNPKGSGTATSPITIGDYGSGALPIINGGTNAAAIKLFAQAGWHIQNIETMGGNTYGIYIGFASSGTYSHFRITNVVVHDVSGTASGRNNGLILIAVTPRKAAVIDDVIVDGATVYNSMQWAGIRVQCGGNDAPAGNPNPIIIRNSTAHDTGGSGIEIYECNHGLIENTTAYNTGKLTTTSPGTPNSTWTWACADCTVQSNEAYLAASAGFDGGAFDIDWNSTDNIVQYNYGHDTEGYCFAVFGAEHNVTVNSVVRYNLCSKNNQDGSIGGEGAIDLFTWNGGSVDGVKIYNNTFYYSPAADQFGATFAALYNQAAFTGTGPRLFKNNLLYSDAPQMIDSLVNGLTLNNNLYWYTGAGSPQWKYNGVVYTSLSSYQSGTGQDAQSLYTNPLLNSPTYHGNGMPTTQFTLQSGSPAINAGVDVGGMGTRDFFGNAIPQGGAFDIGAHESGGGPAPTATPTRTNTPASPTNTPTTGPSPTPTRTNTPAPPTNTPTAGPSPTRTNTPAPTATPGGSTVMHVADVMTTDVNGNPQTTFTRGDTIYWRVKIVDQGGVAVSGASVTTQMLKPDGGVYATATGTTGADGWALFSKSTKGPDPAGTWTINVTNVTKTGATYDPAANVESSTTFTLQ